MKPKSRVRKQFAVVSVLSAALLATVIFVAASASADNVLPADQKAAANRLLQAMQVRQQVLVTPASVMAVRSHSTATDRDAMLSAGKPRLAEFFDGSQLTKEDSDLAKGIAAEADPTFLCLDGGADSLAITSTKSSGTHQLTLAGTIRTWSKVAQVHADGTQAVAQPSNILDITATLSNTTGNWKVTNLQWTFAPGSEP